MFKALSAWQMGSEQMEEYLLDRFTAIFYDTQIPCSEDAITEETGGSRLWKAREEMDPWELLAAAVIGRACLDYIECYEQKDERGMQALQAWFEQNEYSNRAFQELKRMLRGVHNEYQMYRLKRSIRIIT